LESPETGHVEKIGPRKGRQKGKISYEPN